MSKWRSTSSKNCPSCGAQWPQERLELVEALIGAKKAARVAETQARVALAAHPEDAITALAVENEELRENLARANARIAHLNRRTA